MKDVMLGIIGGVLGAAAWAAVIYMTDYEVGIVAWGVGWLVGTAVAFGNKDRERSPMAAGALAVVIAALSISAGKYASVELLLPSEEELVDVWMDESFTQEYVMSFLADEVVAGREAEGTTVVWPRGVDPSNGSQRSDYPSEIWAEATQRWSGLSVLEQTAFREEHETQTRQNTTAVASEMRGSISRDALVATFSPLDLIFFGPHTSRG